MEAESVNIHAAKTHFSRLIERVEGGEEILIARAGRPVARLVPFRPRTKPRVPGRWRDQVVIGPDFDDVNEQLAREFEGDIG